MGKIVRRVCKVGHRLTIKRGGVDSVAVYLAVYFKTIPTKALFNAACGGLLDRGLSNRTGFYGGCLGCCPFVCKVKSRLRLASVK